MIMMTVWTVSVQMTAERPPKTVKRQAMSKRITMAM